jgi:farnesyl diphosphate synthase
MTLVRTDTGWDAQRLAAWSGPHLANVEEALSRWVGIDAPVQLGDAMRYAVLDGGKRLRPLLVMAASEAVHGDAAAALRAACATELIHAYSLVHDDLPCMDNDILRRGKPTVHVQFGEADALLAGDALQALAFELLTPDDTDIPPVVQAQLCRLLARAAGSQGMAGGQAIDLASVGLAARRDATARDAPAQDRRAAAGQRRDGRGLRAGRGTCRTRRPAHWPTAPRWAWPSRWSTTSST